MKIKAAVILSILLLFSTLQEGVASIISISHGSDSCCSTFSVAQDDTNLTECIDLLDLVDNSDEGCCSGADCDCSCCIHLPLFNTACKELLFSIELEKDMHVFSSTYDHFSYTNLFRPPLFSI